MTWVFVSGFQIAHSCPNILFYSHAYRLWSVCWFRSVPFRTIVIFQIIIYIFIRPILFLLLFHRKREDFQFLVRVSVSKIVQMFLHWILCVVFLVVVLRERNHFHSIVSSKSNKKLKTQKFFALSSVEENIKSTSVVHRRLSKWNGIYLPHLNFNKTK